MTALLKAFLAGMVLAMVCVVPVAAQQSSHALPDNPQPSNQTYEKHRSDSWILSQLAVVDQHEAPPLRATQKFNLFWKTSIAPSTLLLAGAEAGISQAEDSHPAWGQGGEGYGKRFGAAMADQASSKFFSTFLYASIFREDPRYFRSGEGSFGHRFGYAVKQEFICHTDSGGRSFHFANVLGAFSSGALSNAYYPEEDRGVELTMSRGGLALAYGALGGVLNEFWPDISRKLHGKGHAAK